MTGVSLSARRRGWNLAFRGMPTCVLLTIVAVFGQSELRAQQERRFLAKADILLYGIALKSEPAEQTVPKNIATIVSTFLNAPGQTDSDIPPFAPDAVVMATLRGPSLPRPLDLTTRANTPFNIPPLTVAGLHTLDNIRLVSNGEVLLRGIPESVTINVIEKLLVTQITARPLTAAEIREKGIVFDRSNFQAYNFTAAFAVDPTGATINLDFPILLPALQSASGPPGNVETIPIISPPGLRSLSTIIPDTLKVQAHVPNLSVVGFTLKIPTLEGKDFFVPPIPGVIVIPGDIGFLNQFFSVLLMVSNAAPDGSNLVVRDLRASLVLPPGKDTVVGSIDDPLAMAQTAGGPTSHFAPIAQPGADGKVGTADDIPSIGPGETANAEFLVEGRREGSHVIEMAIEGTLDGLPVGPVAITGRAAGAVLVRNPTYTLTFIHPDQVAAGEPYTLDVAVTNTSDSPANFVSVNLFARNISGATLVGDASKDIEFIAPGDSATVTFDLISNVSGQVTAATLDSDAGVAGRFELKHTVGDLGIPLSPDSLVLPKEANALPAALRKAVLGMLGKAWAVATAPAAALPKDTLRFSRQIVLDMGVATAEAGLRVSLQEPLRDSATQLALDFFGSEFLRLPSISKSPQDLQFAQDNYIGFDDLRRKSIRGDVFAQAIADLLSTDFAGLGAAAFHRDVAEKISYRPDHLSVLIGSTGAPLPFTLKIVDSQNRQVGDVAANGKVVKQIPFGDYLILKNGAGEITGQMAFLAAPAQGDYSIRLEPVAGATPAPFSLSIVVPRSDGTLRHIVFDNLTAQSAPAAPFSSGDPYRLSISIVGEPGQPIAPASDTTLSDPAPSVVSVVQMKDYDILSCNGRPPGLQIGRIVAVLFSERVTAASVQDRLTADLITSFEVDGNRVVSVALQPGGRIALIGLRDSVGPYVPRQLTVSGATDLRGHTMASQTLPIVITIDGEGGVVTGRVINPDGTPVPFASIRYLTYLACVGNPWRGISQKTTDAEGRFSWDFVLRNLNRIVAVDSETEEFRDIQFALQRNGQHINLDIVMLGRGTFKGRTLDENGQPLRDTVIKITSMTDGVQFGATSAADGTFAVARIPVGNILVEAVNTRNNSKVFISDNIPFAGATTTTDLILQRVEVTNITVKHGNITGHVLRGDGTTPVAGLPVIAYYYFLSQPGLSCPHDGEGYCAVAQTTTDGAGAFAFPGIVAGTLKLVTFDQPTWQQGEVSLTLAADASADATILLSSGVGTVRGVVRDANGSAMSGVRVGGGYSLTTSDANGEFTLTDMPVGRATITAVSDQIGSQGTARVDIVRAGETVNVVVVLEAVGGVAGVVRRSDGVTPAAGIRVNVFEFIGGGAIRVVGTAITDDQGGYSLSRIRVGDYLVSAFTSDFSDGNIVPIAIKFSNQVARGDVKFRGGGGRVTGRVLDDDGVTPLKARVSVSGDQLVVAGGQVGIKFQHVSNYEIADTDFTTGTFSLGRLWVGGFTVRAAGQFSPEPVALENTMPSAGATVQMDIRLQPTSRITGQVFQPDGVTPAGADVVVSYKSDEFATFCSENQGTGETECVSIPQGVQEEVVVTGNNGRFDLPLVNSGTFTITVSDEASGRTGQVRGSVKPGETADLSLRLVGFGSVNVQVFGSDSITPIPGARVVVEQIEFPRKKVTAFANGQGGIVFSGPDAFPEGQFVVTATDIRNGFAGRASGKVASDGEQVVVKVFLYNQSGVVFGTIVKSDGVTPVANAEVVVFRGSAPTAFALTDATGAYRVDQIPLGDISVEVFDPVTARRGSGSGRVDFDRQEVPVHIVQSALGVVRGTIMEAGSLVPLKGWEITLSETSPGRSRQLLKTTSGVDGRFTFPGVPKGTVTLHAVKRDVNATGTVSGGIDREGQVIDLPLLVTIVRPKSGAVEGRAFNPDGTPAVNSQVELCVNGSCATNTVPATSGADGSFSYTQVPLGRHAIRARSQTTPSVGTTPFQINFDGETAGVAVTMVGVSQIRGTVVKADGTPAANAELMLSASPATGCVNACFAFTDPQGAFSFVDVPARTFTVRATDAVTGFKGVVGDTLNPGETKTVQIVLEPTGSVRARVLFQGGDPAPGVVADLFVNGKHIFSQTEADGSILFDTAPLGTFTLGFEDPIGTGIARAAGTIVDTVDLGDIRLDETAPAVGTVTPAPAAAGVPLEQVITLTFSERVNASTINAANITLNDGAGEVQGALMLLPGDMAVTFTPAARLEESTRYTIRVKGVKDLIGKAMTNDFVSSFTSIDLTPPSHLTLSPAPGTNGVTVFTTVRLTFSEPIDPARFVGAPLVVLGPGGPVQGRIDYLFGNTAIVFTPAIPLAQDAIYRVQSGRATDLAGNVQPQALDYQFATTDGTPPTIAGLIGPSSVVENGVATIVADVGATHDVSFVDFFINGTPATTARSVPFKLTLQAIPSFGRPGDQIKITAVATDSSGNRGVTEAMTSLLVTPDQPPVVVIGPPAEGLTARNGDRITVAVRATDDLGVTRIGFKAQTGKPQDAALETLAQPVLDRTETFGFNVPMDAAPGATILIEASASDTKGLVGQATPVAITVLDSVQPVVTITGASTGATARPGQMTTVVVAAQDLGGVRTVSFSTSGAVSFADSRTLDPAQASSLISFTFQVPASAMPGQSVTLHASALDKAGNVGTAADVVLPVADVERPTVTLRTATGSLDIVPGRTVTLIADVSDSIAVSRVELTGSGAFSLTDAKQITPPLGTAQAQFTVIVPDTATPGTILNLQARAIDTSNNVSNPALLALTVKTLQDVVLPPNAVVLAGRTVEIPVELSGGAPEGGLVVTFASANTNVATVTPAVTFAAGETSKVIGVTGVSGATVAVSAFIQGVERAGMTIAVQGGVVSGIVLNPNDLPVNGALVTVATGFANLTATTDASGAFMVVGANAASVTVTAVDPITSFRGSVAATLNRLNGFANVTVHLIAAGAIHGTVREATGQASAGPGVKVDLFASSSPSTALATTFTDETGAYRFPLVPLGNYTLDASAADGRRGRTTAMLTTSGEDPEKDITFLGRGAVTGTVFNSSKEPVPGAVLTFTSSSIFGGVTINRNAEQDGTFRFDPVFVGNFSITARDPVTDRTATATGSIASDGQVVQQDLVLASYGTVRGTVYRFGGTTPVPNASVILLGKPQTFTDLDGKYEFQLVPLGSHTVSVNDAATRGKGSATGSVSTQGQILTLDVTLRAQGSVTATVVNANAVPVPGAHVTIEATTTDQLFRDTLSGTTGSNGSVVIDHVLAGTVKATATAAGLNSGPPIERSLAAGQVLSITLTLQETASIVGTVLAPNDAPQTTGYVSIAGYPSVQLGETGTFRFDGLPVRPQEYEVKSFDTQNHLRALAKVTLTTNNQVETVNLKFVAENTVRGRVIYPEGTSAPNRIVQVRSLNPQFGRLVSVQTNAAGNYEAGHMAAGVITVSASDPARGLLGENSGSIHTQDEPPLTLDILLASNGITLPRTLLDANAFSHDIQASGAIANGTQSVFFGSGSTQGGAQLDLVIGGVATRFVGNTVGTIEDQSREIAVRQQDLAGLDVTRKIFVAKEGYFARYLETISNPTAAPITLDVRVTSYVRGGTSTNLVATSSGDAVLDASDPATADRWVVVDDGDLDPFVQGGFPSLAFVFDGAAAPERAVPAVLAVTNFMRPVTYAWTNVTIPPGGIVSYMHFVSQETSRASAAAAADRLGQLAPEAIAGLAPEEAALVRNFVVPADGTSTVAPLPPIGGTVTGRLLASDGVILVPNGTVTFKSTVPVYGRTYSVNSNATTAAFTFATNLNGQFNQVAIPLAPFTLTGRHSPLTSVTTTLSADFAAGEPTTTRDVLFVGTGNITGLLTTGAGLPAPKINVQLLRNLLFIAQVQTDSNGRFTFTGLAPSTFPPYELRATEPLSGYPTGVVVEVSADETATRNFSLAALGTLSIQVNFADGTPAAGRQVLISRTGFQGPFLSAGTTDANGRLDVPNSPATSALIRVFHPLSPTTQPTEVVAVLQTQGQVVPVNITLPIVDVIAGKVTLPTGAAATGATVQLRFGSSINQATSTDSLGNYSFTIRGAPLNTPWTVRAYNPGQTVLFKDVPVTFTADNVTTTVNITLPAIASLRVVATLAGSPLVGARVQVKNAFDTFFVNAGVTDSTGTRIVTNVPEGEVSVQLLDGPTFALLGLRTVTIGPANHGQTIDVPFVFDTALPVELFDGNGMRSDIQRDGTLRTGTNGAFSGSGGLQLSSTIATLFQTFTGATYGTTEESGREIGILQSTGNALITRKVYVPSDGYFTRYLEIFRNTTAAPVAVRPSIFTTLGGNSATVDSSDGDTWFTDADSWVVTDDGDVSPTSRPAMAFVVNGGVGLAGFDGTGFSTPIWTWSAVTVQPGQSAIFMHFVSQHPTRAGAFAAAQRLAQLPPEALAGLSADERASIVNWVVPADGVSSVQPLPARTGSVTGRSITGDGQTGAALSKVTLTSSNHPYFAAKTATADANGQFTFANVAIDAFDLQATDALTSVASPTVSGSFAGGQTTAARDVVFSNTGVVRGLVRRLGAPVAGAPVSLAGAAFTATVSTGADGRYFLPGLPAGTYTLLAQAAGSGAAVAQVVNGQTTTSDITIGTGSIVGQVTLRNGSNAVGAPVLLIDPSGAFPSRPTTTDSAGRFAFPDVTPGLPYIVRAGHPTAPTALVFSALVSATADGQPLSVDLTLPAVADVRVTVVESDGTTAVPFPFVSIDREDGNGFQAAAFGDIDGVAVIPNVSGDFSVRATDDAGILGTVSGSVPPSADGGVVEVTITAAGGVARVRGTAFAADGLTPLPEDNRLVVELVDVASNAVIMQSSNGVFDFNVRVGNNQELTLQARSPLDSNTVVTLGFGILVSPGNDYAGLDLYLPVPVVSGVVLQADGFVVPFPNVSLMLTALDGQSETFFATRTPGNGEYGIPVLRLGDYELTAQDPDSGLSATLTGSIGNPLDVVNQEVVLPGGGTVNGVVLENGAVVPSAEVTIISGSVTRTMLASQPNGLFAFSNVPPGPIRLHACNSFGGCSSLFGFVEAGATLPVILNIQYGSVSGRVYDAFGNAVEGAAVSAYNRADSGMLGGSSTTSDENGFFFLNGVPAGAVTIVAFAPGSSAGGLSEISLEAFGSGFAEIYLTGAATTFNYWLESGPAGFFLGCDGSAAVGPDDLNYANASAVQYARPGGTMGSFPCLPFADLDQSERAPVLDAGYVDAVGLDVAREVFVPDAGGFARYLEVLTNRTTQDMTVRVRVSGTLTNGAPAVTRTAAESDNTHALYDEGNAMLGLVFGGYDAPVQATTRFVNGSANYSYEWTITIPPGETRRLLHFVVQSGLGFGNYAPAIARTEALAVLGDGNALAGLSAEEISTIVNFVIFQ